MHDVEQLCERVIVIDNGTLFFDGSISEITERYAPYETITLQVSEPASEQLLFAGSPGIIECHSTGKNAVNVVFDPHITSLPSVISEAQKKCRITNLQSESKNLDVIVREMYRQLEVGRKQHD